MEAAMPRAFEGGLVTEERRLLLEKLPEAEREGKGYLLPPSHWLNIAMVGSPAGQGRAGKGMDWA